MVNFENMRKLYVGLKANRHVIELEMSEFADDEEEAVESSSLNICESACCVIGFSPSCGIPVDDEDIDFHYGEIETVNWRSHSDKKLIAGHSFEKHRDLWDFAFATRWSNSTEEALSRIKLILEKNVPDDWEYSDVFSN